MKPLAVFNIVPDLPEKLAPLWDLAYNLWWTWDQNTIRTFRSLDPQVWMAVNRNPLRFLSSLTQEQLDRLAQDDAMVSQIRGLVEQFARYQSEPTWYSQTHADANLRIAYFSAEFGLSESLPIYAGGLGVLAGDHLKSASDLGLPLVGVGLLYRQGYFRQVLNPDGWQLELYPENDFDQLPVRQVHYPTGKPVVIEVSYPAGPVYAQVWSAQIGRVPLYLLDTNLEDNRPEDRNITSLLYGGDREMRIRQEILLGIGGMRALAALAYQPSICHMNEGHSAFQGLERIRLLMEEQGLSFDAAREASAAGNIFTTHTPVAAGNDWFSPDLVEMYLASYRQELGLSREKLLGLGRVDPDDNGSEFCMTVLALRLSAQSNGVSRLHGQVSRRMWAGLWPRIAEPEVPIASITNGIHPPSWISVELSELYDRYLGDAWRRHPEDVAAWQNVARIPDRELWQVRQFRRHRLLEHTRFHLRHQFNRQGMPPARVARLLQGLDPEALTIGFARRFATYKRGSLIFHHLKRLESLFADTQRPIQLLFGGKAHPHDHPGKELIREIVSLSRQEPFLGRVFFLEDYDMNVARYMVQGCDVWLNNPRRPQEASGTSGMKAIVNGVLNISVADGWWVEACELYPGWTIGRGEVYEDLSYQDEVEAAALCDLLETEVIPLFYSRDAEGLPREWTARVKESIAALAPSFNTSRMVREYAERLYLPNQRRWEQLNADRDRTTQLSQWKARVRSHWSRVRIGDVEIAPPPRPKVGMLIPVRATVTLGELSPQDIKVELYMGKVNVQHEISQAQIVPLHYQSSNGEDRHLFAGEMPCTTPGSHGYTLRVVPSHQDLRDPLEMGLVHWA